MARALLLAGALLALAAGPARAADTLTLDLESGPPLGAPIERHYEGTHFVRWVAADPGFRPARRSAPGLARSGSVAADIGADRCAPEAGAANCEFPVGGTRAQLTRTAQRVTLHAGLFAPANGQVTVQVVAHRANGTEAGRSAAVPVSAAGFTAAVTASSAAADIARFDVVVDGPGETGAAVGFDDLELSFPPGTLPDAGVAAPPDTVAVLVGASADVPLTVTRLNGSDGELHWTVTDLPPGVSAVVLPDPLPGTQEAATLRLSADGAAAPFDVPQSVTVTADPRGDGGVAPAPRSTTVPVRVAAPFVLAPRGAQLAAVPTCATVDLPFRLARDRAFTGTVTLAVDGLPAGVSAEVLPGATIPPGGGFTVDGVVRLRGPVAPVPFAAARLRATSPGAPDRVLPFDVRPATPAASLERTLGFGPQSLQPGTAVRVTGTGFCPGTAVVLGAGRADAVVEPDGRALTFTVPRKAVHGPALIEPPVGPRYATTNALAALSFRERSGFPFRNFAFSWLSIEELADAFGRDELFIKVNPCWPWGSCDVVTGFLNPLAAVWWGVLQPVLRGSGGHCFGMSVAVQELTSGRPSLQRFGPGVGPSALASPAGAVGDYLDGRHALQASRQFLTAYALRDRSLAGQLAVLRAELAAGRRPVIALADSAGVRRKGHAMTAYDLVERPGGHEIHVYDSNRPFTPDERTSASAHAAAEDGSTIHVQPGRWSFAIGGATTWTGGDDGTLYVLPGGTLTDDPDLPGIGDLGAVAWAIFGSEQDAVVLDALPTGGELLPALDPEAPAGSSGWVLGRRGTASLVLRGVAAGTYAQAVTGDGFVGGVSGVRTAPGVRDRLTGTPRTGSVEFAGGRSRAVTLELARDDGVAASVRTRASAGGRDTAQLGAGGTVAYAHDGAPARVVLRVQRVRRDGGPEAFTSPPLRVRGGERLTAAPVAGRLDRMRVTVRRRGGRTTSRVVASRGGARLRLTSVRVRGRVVTVRARVAGVRDGVLGVAVRATRGRQVVARRGAGLAGVRSGTRTVRIVLPASAAHGALRVRVDARVVTPAASATASRTARRR